MNCQPTNHARGFTLIEIVVVVVILGILTAFAVPRFFAINDQAERAVVESFIGTLKSARTLAYADFVTANQLPSGYVGPQDFSLYGLVRCDNIEAQPLSPGQPGGHYASLAGLRDTLFRDPTESVCQPNSIVFTTKSGRQVTISGAGGVTWSATPSY
jgi:prepilin-type N-terminal cleavage/methylation domain-containing protein